MFERSPSGSKPINRLNQQGLAFPRRKTSHALSGQKRVRDEPHLAFDIYGAKGGHDPFHAVEVAHRFTIGSEQNRVRGESIEVGVIYFRDVHGLPAELGGDGIGDGLRKVL